MTDKEKLDAIRAEIHRLVDVRGYDKEMANDLFAFMDSLPNEPVSEDLDEAAKKYGTKKHPMTTTGANESACDFKAGAKWQKEHIMAKAIYGTARPDDNEIWCNLASSNLKDGDKVKVLVIKEN